MSETAFLGVQELGRLYRDGALSPVEATRQAIERMERLEPKLNAVSHIVATAMQDAERLAADLRSSRDLGALHGIPVAIKDLIEVKDAPTGFGSRVRAPAIAQRRCHACQKTARRRCNHPLQEQPA